MGLQKMRFFKKFKRVHIIFVIAVIAYSFVLVSIVQAVTPGTDEPGSEENPLVAQDYVDSKINVLQARIDELSEKLKKAGAGQKFEVIQVMAGKQLVAGASTEIIIRSGKATAVASEKGGLSDLISGVDIPTGGNIPKNHLLLVPRDDGRGFKAQTDLFVLIKGEYSIK
jgi:hypothetical protein